MKIVNQWLLELVVQQVFYLDSLTESNLAQFGGVKLPAEHQHAPV